MLFNIEDNYPNRCMSLKNLLIIFITPVIMLSCFTSKMDRKARRVYNKEISKEKILLYSNYEGALNSSHTFTLRDNYKFAYSSYNLGAKYSVGNWKQRGVSDTIDLDFVNGHGIYASENFIVIKNLTDSILIKKSSIKFTPSDTLHGGSSFPILRVDNKLFSLIK